MAFVLMVENPFCLPWGLYENLPRPGVALAFGVARDGVGVMESLCGGVGMTTLECPYCGRLFDDPPNNTVPEHEIPEFSDSAGAWMCKGSGVESSNLYTETK